MNRASVWLSLAIPMVIMACAGVNPPPGGNGAGRSGGGGGGDVAGGGGNGSGGRTGGGPGGMGVTVEMGGSMCGLQTFNVNRKPVEIFLVLDRSKSMDDDANGTVATTSGLPSKWTQLIPALTATVQQADPTISWGLKAFPEDGAECASATLTNNIDLMITPSNAAAMATAIGAVKDLGNGTPTGAAIRAATTYLTNLSKTDDSRKYILLATDGEPSCSGTVGNITKDTGGARADAMAAVSAAATAGFHTFVVGVATTKANDAASLNDLAVAGLEPTTDMRPGATRFYLASNQQQLTTTLEGIVNPVASNCVFPLSSPPPVPDNIAVKVDGSKTPQDTGHAQGWDYTDPSYTAVQVYGPACEEIKNNGNMVEIIFGCKGIVIP